MARLSAAKVLNRLAGTEGRTEVAAANIAAGTWGLSLSGALNAIAETEGLTEVGAANALAGTGDTGGLTLAEALNDYYLSTLEE